MRTSYLPIISDLILLGTVHNDPLGFKRLDQFLHSHNPDCIFVELSPYALRFRLRHQRCLHQTFARHLKQAADEAGIPWKDAVHHPEMVAIRRQIGLPSEYRAAACYVRETDSKVFPIDYSLFSRKWLASWPQLLSSTNLATLLSLPPSPPAIPHIYDFAALSIAGTPSSISASQRLYPTGKDPLWNVRERHMAKAIIRVCEAFLPQKPVYLGGWWHLSSGGEEFPTLRDILNVPLSQCLLLDRWQNC